MVYYYPYKMAIETNNYENNIDANLWIDENSLNINFDSTIAILDSIEMSEEAKDPKYFFNLFIQYLQESPDKLNKINNNKIEKLYSFISDTNNKDYILSEYVAYIKNFNSDSPKFDEKDQTVFVNLKKKIEEIYNWPDGKWIDMRQLDQKIFTQDFNSKSLLKLWMTLDSKRNWHHISLDEWVVEYCNNLWVDLDDYQNFVDKFNSYNEKRILKIRDDLSNMEIWALCRNSFSDSQSDQKEKYKILDTYGYKIKWSDSWMDRKDFLNQFGKIIFDTLSDTQNNFVGQDEFYDILGQNEIILRWWIYDFGSIIEDNLAENVVAWDLEWDDFLSKLSWDVDASVILSIIRRATNQEKKNKITQLIKNKQIDELFTIIGVKTKKIDETFFNELYNYLDVEDLNYWNIWHKHDKLIKEKIFLSLWTCDTQLKQLVLDVIWNPNDLDDIRHLQLKLIDVDLDPNNINLDDILDIDGTIWANTQKWISNYIDTFCDSWDDIHDLWYIMQEKAIWKKYTIWNNIIIWVENWNFLQWVWISWDSLIQIWTFDKNWNLVWLWVSVSIDWTKEKWIYKDWKLEWKNCVRILWNRNKEEWIFVWWLLKTWARYENKLYSWYEIMKEWEFENWQFVKGTKTKYTNWEKIIENWQFNKYWELHWKECVRRINDVEIEWYYGNWELIDEVVFEAVEEAKSIVAKNPKYGYWADWSGNRYDCSHFVYRSYKKTIPNLTYSDTSSMISNYKNFWFTYHELKNLDDLKYWDILRRNWHTEIYCGHKQIIWAHSKEQGVSLTKRRDSYLKGFSWYLRYEPKNNNK